MKKVVPDLGFERAVAIVDGRHVSMARFRCVECGHTLELRQGNKLSTIAPHVLVMKVKQLGWKAHDTRKSSCYCPKCAGPQTNNVNSELEKVTFTMDKEPKLITGSGIIAPVVPRPLTGNQRVQIRGLLDQYFDDSTGRYLDSMNDGLIAAKLDVPRIHVENMREAAYGPIRVNPVLEGLQKDMGKLMEEHGALGKKIIELSKLVNQHCGGIS